MTVEIVGAAAVTATLLALGVQIIFYTKSFGEEYEEKRDAIREAKNTLLVDEIEELLDFRKSSTEEGIYVDEGDVIREFETLARVRQYAMEVESWVGIIERGKGLIRKLGLSFIASGVIVGIVFTLLISMGDKTLASLVIVYILGPSMLVLIFFALRFVRLVRSIDNEIVAVMQRRTGMSKEA